MTYGELKKFTVTLSNRILCVQSHSFIKKYYKRGCLCIIWLIPSCLSDAVYYAASVNTNEFAQLRIQYIMIGKHIVKPSEGYNKGMYTPPTHQSLVMFQLGSVLKPLKNYSYFNSISGLLYNLYIIKICTKRCDM